MIIFVYFFAAVTAEAVQQAIPQDDLYQKLKNYQNLTGLSTEKIDLLWKERHDPGIKSI